MSKIDLEPLPQIYECVETLREMGIVRIKNFLQTAEVELLIEEYQILKKVRNSEVVHQGNRTNIQYLLGNSPIAPATVQIFPVEFMRKLADSYLDQPNSFSGTIDFVHSKPGIESNELNLHYGVVRKLRFLIYLTTTDERRGCFHCELGSHKQTQRLMQRMRRWQIIPTHNETRTIAERNSRAIIPIPGVAGTLLIFDTDLFHRAGIVHEQERLIIRSECIVPVCHAPLYRGIRFIRKVVRQHMAESGDSFFLRGIKTTTDH